MNLKEKGSTHEMDSRLDGFSSKKISFGFKKQEFLDSFVSNTSLGNLLVFIQERIQDRNPTLIIAFNANKLYQMQHDTLLKEALKNAEVVLPEYAVFWGAKRIGNPLKSPVGGITLMKALIKENETKSTKMFFFGSKNDVLEDMIKTLKDENPKINISGYLDGYFSDEDSVIKKISQSKSDILFCALGSPKQEIFLNKNKERFNVPILIGVGGSFDVLAGRYKEAPGWMRHGFEWLYRLAQNPKALWKRYLITNSYFIYRIIKYKLNSL